MKQRTIAAGSVELVIAEAGEGGRPLLLLHGFTGAKEDFTEWLDRLAGEGWHAVAPDHRGHGASSKPAGEESYSMEILASDAFALVDALGWDRFTLLGHSMGGMVAQLMASASPEQLDGLVLMDTGHGPLRGIDAGQLELAIQIAKEQGMAVLTEAMAKREGPLETEAHRRVLRERPGYQEFGDRKMRDSSPDMYAAIVRQIVTQPDRLDALRSLPASLPALVIVGDQDAPFIEASEAMADAIPGARLALIPDAGHSPQFENPNEWWDALSGFLAGIAAEAPARQ